MNSVKEISVGSPHKFDISSVQAGTWFKYVGPATGTITRNNVANRGQ